MFVSNNYVYTNCYSNIYEVIVLTDTYTTYKPQVKFMICNPNNKINKEFHQWVNYIKIKSGAKPNKELWIIELL